MDLKSTLAEWEPRILSILRIVAAILFMEHGTQKILGFPEPKYMPGTFELTWFSGMMEMIGGFLLLIGLFVRPTAFLLSGLMAFAYWIAHAPQNFFPVLNSGDAAILFCFVFLYLVFAGGGAWSIDACRKQAT